MTRLRWLVLFTALQFCVGEPLFHHVLLSWKPSGQPWHFAFYSTLPSEYSLHDLNKPDMVILGVPQLKKHLAQHQPWRDIVWRDLPSIRNYPDLKTSDEIQAFARTHNVNLEIVPRIID